MEDVKNWFANITDNQRLIFLARVSYELTIHGRDFGFAEIDATAEQKILGFKGLNELQHQITQSITHLADGTNKYSGDVLWDILQEKATAFGLSNRLSSSIKRARSHSLFMPVSKTVQ